MSILTAVCLKQLIRTLQPKTVERKLFATASTKVREKKEPKQAIETVKETPKLKNTATKDVLKYLDSKEELKHAKTLVSPFLLKTHKSTPEALYLVSNDTARDIVKLIADRLEGDVPVIEVNPGIGCLTKELFKLNIKNLKLFEMSTHHGDILGRLKNEYPDKFNYMIADFFGMWKVAHQDKMDGGNRLDILLHGIPTKSWGDGVSMKILGCIASLTFLNHLILSVIFQESIVAMGRPELFITLPPACYYCLVPPPNSPQMSHLLRPLPVLFNLLFDHKLITKVSRKDFLPWHHSANKKNVAKLKHIDSEYMYLVHIVGKPKPPCNPEHLPLLWYFCKHHLMNRNNKIIPMLEQWIPGCGVWLITGQDPPGSNMETLPTTEDALLPHMNIFTQFRDLTSQQKLTVFKKFISWPEFQMSPFKESMETQLFKVVAAGHDSPKEEEDEANESQGL